MTEARSTFIRLLPGRPAGAFPLWVVIVLLAVGCSKSTEPEGTSAEGPATPRATPTATDPTAHSTPPAAPGGAGPAPRLSVPEPTVDVGEILKGESREVEFEIRNAGDAPLVIQRVITVCGCTVASLITDEGTIVVPLPGTPADPAGLATLAPGGDATVRVEFQSKTQPLGKIEKHVTLRTNDPEQVEFRLKIHAELQQAFVLEPESIVFGELKRGETPTRTLKLRAAALKNVRVTGFDDVPDFLRANAERDETNPDVQTISVTLTRDAPVGLLQHTIQARLDHPTFEHLPIPVFATVNSRMRIDSGNPENRERIDFEVLRVGEETKRSVEISTELADETFHVTSVDIDSKYASILRTEIVTVVPGSRYRVDVFALPTADTKAKFVRGTLNIHSDHPDLPVKAIAFQGWLKDD